MSFDRKGKCPVCKKDFQSCPHTWDYVHKVLKLAEMQKDINKMQKDVARILKKR